MLYDTDIGSINQWGVVSVSYTDADASTYAGHYFRSDGNMANVAYALRYERTVTDIVWRYCTGASCTTIATWDHSLDDGDSFGYEVEGTGNDTVLRVWDFGGSVPARGSWGAADHTFTDNPASAANTGTYIGLYDGHVNLASFDDFAGGSYTP